VTVRVVGRGLKRRLALRLPCGTSRYFGQPTIPNDYSSTAAIPKLNFRAPERTITMQGTYANRCRERHPWGRTRMDDEISKGRPVSTPILNGFRTLDIQTDRLLSSWLRAAGVPDGALKAKSHRSSTT